MVFSYSGNYNGAMVFVGIMWMIVLIGFLGNSLGSNQPRRILLDTDVDADDVFALLYLLKQNRTEFDLQVTQAKCFPVAISTVPPGCLNRKIGHIAYIVNDFDSLFVIDVAVQKVTTAHIKTIEQAITISANAWSDAGHAINNLYDILFMMNRDDIPVGVGGEGGISPNGTISPDVGGYQPIIDQLNQNGSLTVNECRYRQVIPVGQRGRLDVNTNYGLRKGFLPQGGRKYTPLEQLTAQQVMKNAVSAGPITVFLTGSHTNFAIFLMSNPHLKKNIEHIYAMGGAIGASCCLNSSNSCQSEQCSPIGNLYPQDSNPYAEYNIFVDPLAAYLVLHSGIPLTLIPLDATNTIPVSKNFFTEFERRQNTNEAQYCFQTLKMIRNTWNANQFNKKYCMWDTFMAGIALSIMRNSQNDNGENEFAEMEYMNLTVVTSNKPYGISDGSNPLINGLAIPEFIIQKNGVHSGHVQMGMRDPFCLDLKDRKGKCQDGYTKEVTGPEAVRVLVATKSKPSQESGSLLDKEFYRSFLDVLNRPEQASRFNISTQFPYYKEVLYKPDFANKSTGKSIVFDMDMSAGDFLALLYLLKLPVELINLKGILISPTGWATPATIDVVYDLLHMMGRDDIPVGLGDVFAVGEANPTFRSIGDCKYAKAIPPGSGGFLDSDTLYGLARDLPRSPRRYSVKYGALRDTDHLERRQPLALDVWKSVVASLEPGSKITILTNGPLTNLAQIIDLENSSSVIEDAYIVGGNIGHANEKGNVFTVPSNEYAEFNMFLDPLAAKAVLESKLDIKLIPLHMHRTVSSFDKILSKLQNTNSTPESLFSRLLLSRLWQLQQRHQSYHHVDTFLGEILGAVILGGYPHLNQTYKIMSLKIFADGDISRTGHIIIDEEQGNLVETLESFNVAAYYEHFTEVLGYQRQAAVLGSFEDQKRIWNTQP